MRHLKIPLALLALVGLIALAGCGGSDSTSSDSSASSDSTTASTAATDSTASDSTAATTSTSSDPAAAAYGQGLTQALTDFGTGFQQLGTKIQGASNPGDVSSGVSDLQSQISTTVNDLKALDPPAAAQGGQDQIISALENLSSELGKVGDAVQSGNANGAKDAVKQLQPAVSTFQQDLQAGLTSIAQAGVPIGGPGG